MPNWVDVSAPDVPAARAFYTAVFGWTFREPDAESGADAYFLAQVDGRDVAAVGPLMSPAPAAWTLYLATDDALATVSAAEAAGATVLAPVGEVGPLGRIAVLADPTGAVFGLWEAGTHIGLGRVNEPGSLVWEDLATSDPDAARAFFEGLFGYRYAPVDMAPPEYQTFELADGIPAGGMGPMMGAPEGTPPHWTVCFATADTEAAVAAATANGGSLLGEPFDTPYGRMATLADPGGATFMVVQSDPSTAPDRSG
jgi:hypothetical protein